MNVEPHADEALPTTNINIVTQGNKRGEDRYAEETPVIVKVASPQKG